MQTSEQDFIDHFIEGGADRYSFDGNLFEDKFNGEAIRLVLHHRKSSDQIGQFAGLIEMGVNLSLEEKVFNDGGILSISATKAMHELGIHRNLIAALELVSKCSGVQDADKIKAMELKERIDGR